MQPVITIPTWGTGVPQTISARAADTGIELYTHPADGESVRRLRLECGGAKLELLPSKGLSVLGCSFNGRELFWTPPLDRIPDPRELDLTAAILINGTPQPGARWLEGFLGGVEMMGLGNWGMFGRDEKGNLLSLHGNASNIPVPSLAIGTDSRGRIVCEGRLSIYGDFDLVRPSIDSTPQWEITRRVILNPAGRELSLEDRIVNVSGESRFADWAYHIQLRPEDGCRFLVPSREVAPRFGGSCETDFETWRSAADEGIREERGYVHKGLLPEQEMVPTLLRYPDGSGIEARIPHAPYTLSWNSCGGALSREFLLPENPNSPFIPRSWNGVGPEAGASALDHDGNTDPDVEEKPLNSGEGRDLSLVFRMLDAAGAAKLEGKIEAATAGREK